MIFGTPMTWLFAEIFSLVLFFICMAHASKQKNPTLRIFEFFAIVIGAAIYENIGVAVETYDYDLHRIMMIGKVPLEILLLEAEIWYVAMILAEKLKLPNWTKPFVVGLMASVQDMTLDPSAVFDLHKFDGVMSGQWDWTFRYESTFFGIPFFNFSGWLYMMTYFTIWVLVGRWLYEKYNNKFVEYTYPFLAGILTPLTIAAPFTKFLLWAYPFFPMYNRNAELIMLILNYAFPIILLFLFRKRFAGFDLKNDKIVFGIPVALHIYDIIIGFSLKIEEAYIPSIVITLIHCAFFFYLYRKSKMNPDKTDLYI